MYPLSCVRKTISGNVDLRSQGSVRAETLERKCGTRLRWIVQLHAVLTPTRSIDEVDRVIDSRRQLQPQCVRCSPLERSKPSEGALEMYGDCVDYACGQLQLKQTPRASIHVKGKCQSSRPQVATY